MKQLISRDLPKFENKSQILDISQEEPIGRLSEPLEQEIMSRYHQRAYPTKVIKRKLSPQRVSKMSVR